MHHLAARHIPTIRSYKQADALYTNTKPVRGRDKDIRPLRKDRRNPDSMRIEKGSNGEVRLMLYRTTVVTFRPDGEMHLSIGQWPSQSTCSFIDNAQPYASCYRKDGKVVIRLGNNVYELPPDGSPLRIKLEEERLDQRVINPVITPKVINPVTQTKVYVDRRKYNNVMRQNYAEFLAYVTNLFKLRDENRGGGGDMSITMAMSELARLVGIEYSHTGADAYKTRYYRLCMLVSNTIKGRHHHYLPLPTLLGMMKNGNEPDSYYKALGHIAVEASIRSGNGVYGSAFTVSTTSPDTIYTIDNIEGVNPDKHIFISLAAVKNVIKDLIYRVHAQEVFKVETMPEGVLGSSRYKKYINQ